MAELPPVTELVKVMAEPFAPAPRAGPHWRRVSVVLPAVAAVSSGSNSWKSWRKPRRTLGQSSGYEGVANGPQPPQNTAQPSPPGEDPATAAAPGNVVAARSSGGRRSVKKPLRALGESSGGEGVATGPQPPLETVRPSGHPGPLAAPSIDRVVAARSSGGRKSVKKPLRTLGESSGDEGGATGTQPPLDTAQPSPSGGAAPMAASDNDLVAAAVASRVTEDSLMMASYSSWRSRTTPLSARSISLDSFART